MYEEPLVTVVIVTWNRKQDVLESIQSVYDQSYRNYEIVVVDNGSTDGTGDAIRQTYPDVVLIPLERNIGIAAGRNPGIRAAKGEFIFCLDSDASLADDTLPNVVRKFGAEPDIGILNSKVINSYTGELDDRAGWSYTEKDKAYQDTEFLSFSFSETGVAFRKEVFEKAGLFWDFLFFGAEGQEFSLRTWDTGYKILYYPSAMIHHRASPARRVEGCDRVYYDIRNVLSMYLVRHPWWAVLLLAPLKIGVSLVKGIRRKCLGMIFRGLVDVYVQMPVLMAQRQPIRSETARFLIQLQRQHGPLSWDLITWFKYKSKTG